MTLEQLNIVFQLVGTLGVIGSLIFVGLQVRQNTKATRVQVQENMTSGYISVARVLIDHAEVFTRGIAASRSRRSLMPTSSSTSVSSSPSLSTSKTFIHNANVVSSTTNHGRPGASMSSCISISRA
jgi:hypothetical protein